MSDAGTREEFIAAVRAQAFETGGRRIVHCQGSFAGADWDEEDVIAAIREAEVVSWAKGQLGHDLHVLDVTGKLWRFQVSPAAGTSACDGAR